MKKIVATFCIFALLMSLSLSVLAANAPVQVDVNDTQVDSDNTNQVIVKFQDNTSVVTKFIVNHVCSTDSVKKLDSDSYVVKPDNDSSVDALVTEYSKCKSVEYAEPDYATQAFLIPNDTYYLPHQKATFDSMSITDGWDFSQGNSSITIAILDTGVDFNHPDLKGKLLTNGYDFVNSDNDPSDNNGHGTLSAGVVSACINNGLGITGVTNCKILPIKVLDNQGHGYTSAIVSGIKYAVDKGAKVINISLGCTGNSTALQDAIDYANKAGVVVVAASGNSNTSVMYPAGCNNVIAVGATFASGEKASYSCYGDNLDLMAVGNDVYSTYYFNGESTYAGAYGTSIASPFVASLAGLILSINSSLSPEQVTSIMEDTADDLGTPGFDQYYGYGRVNFCKALTKTVNLSRIDTPPTITLKGNSTITVKNGETYTDEGAIASDTTDGDLTSEIIVDNRVDTSKNGEYKITYTVQDSAGNKNSITRTVIIESNLANTKPVIKLNGNSFITINEGQSYNEPGATVIDAEDGDITENLAITGSINTSKPGTYTITYTANDSQGLAATPVQRTVTVLANENKNPTPTPISNTKPIITMMGSSSMTVNFKGLYVDEGVTAKDKEDGDLTADVIVTGSVDTSKVGKYKIVYTVTDSNGATATATRIVYVFGNTEPFVNVLGPSVVHIKINSNYNDAGAVASDKEDGDLTSIIITKGSVNTSAEGTYTITYTVKDSGGLTATCERDVVVTK